MKRHATSKPRKTQDLLYDPVPEPSHAERAMTLATAVTDGALATTSIAHAGCPYGSLVLLALYQREPVFLLSALAEHTQNLRASSACSVMVKEAGPNNPLALGRVSLVGTCAPIGAPEDLRGAREAFLHKHPSASFYADFGDFAFWKLQVTAARYIGGFGRMSWIDANAWHAADPDPISPAAQGILAHMNNDHPDALPLYCQAFSRSGEVPSATMTGIDRYGFEMSAETAEGPRPIRIAFDSPLTDPSMVRGAMVELLTRARSAL